MLAAFIRAARRGGMATLYNGGSRSGSLAPFAFADDKYKKRASPADRAAFLCAVIAAVVSCGLLGAAAVGLSRFLTPSRVGWRPASPTAGLGRLPAAAPMDSWGVLSAQTAAQWGGRGAGFGPGPGRDGGLESVLSGAHPVPGAAGGEANAAKLAGASSPGIRYSHAAVVWKESMVITHGYFYDAASHSPVWLADTWAFALSPPFGWRRLLTRAAKAGGAVPWARYAHSASLAGDSLLLFGGTDGGYHAHGRQDYVAGWESADLWALDLTTGVWTELKGPGARPPPRYLHTGVTVGKGLFIYGGSNRSDLWCYGLESKAWADLSATTALGPGRRQGHAATALPGSGGFAIHGGTRWGEGPWAPGRDIVLGDTWVYHPATQRWTELAPAAGPGLTGTPAGIRVFHAAAATAGGLVIAGGSGTIPGVNCLGDAWLLPAAPGSAWTRLPPLPAPTYHASLVASGDTVYVFGGHLCTMAADGLPFSYTNGLWRLRVDAKGGGWEFLDAA